MVDTTLKSGLNLGYSGPRLVVITGMAGAGKTQALHTFEDAGYFCIDNLPPSLLLNLVTLAGLPGSTTRKLAVVCDLRSREFFVDLEIELEQLAELHVNFSLLFLDATDNSLLTRYKETRRRHPLCDEDMTLAEGINLERETLSGVREMAHYVIDTTDKDTRALRKEIRSFYDQRPDTQGLRISVFSFGFKHGFPHDVDTMIDVRFLPNPFYQESLRYLTGQDTPVRDYVLENVQTQEFLVKWKALLETIMPGYVQEGKRYLSIGVGCTGGQHRSVVLAEETTQFLKACGYNAHVSHRDVLLAKRMADSGLADADENDPDENDSDGREASEESESSQDNENSQEAESAQENENSQEAESAQENESAV